MYRDLKPENILIAESGHIRLTDFDLSQVVENGVEVTVQQKKGKHLLGRKQPDWVLGVSEKLEDQAAAKEEKDAKKEEKREKKQAKQEVKRMKKVNAAAIAAGSRTVSEPSGRNSGPHPSSSSSCSSSSARKRVTAPPPPSLQAGRQTQQRGRTVRPSGAGASLPR